MATRSRPPSGQVVVPEQPGRDRPPRPPRVAELGHLRGVGPAAETLDLADRCGQGDVADRPHVGPPQDHQQVDRRGPRPDPGDGLERRMDRQFVESLERVEVERAGLDRLGERPTVARLLPAEPDGQELGIGQLEEARRGKRPDDGHEPVERGLRRRQRDLLLEDDVQERRKARAHGPRAAAGPWRRRCPPGPDRARPARGRRRPARPWSAARPVAVRSRSPGNSADSPRTRRRAADRTTGLPRRAARPGRSRRARAGGSRPPGG